MILYAWTEKYPTKLTLLNTTRTFSCANLSAQQFWRHNICTSMTSLLTHIVAHSTRPSFRPKINNQPLKKFLSLAVSWVKVVKNGKILTSKSIFYVKYYPNLSIFFFIEEYDFRGTLMLFTFFENFNFFTTLFPKMTSNFWQLLLNWAQDLKTF